MDVRIGITQTTKELDIEMPEDADAESVKVAVAGAFADDATLWLTDRQGRQVGVPSGKIAYIEIGRPDDGRRIGFGG